MQLLYICQYSSNHLISWISFFWMLSFLFNNCSKTESESETTYFGIHFFCGLANVDNRWLNDSEIFAKFINYILTEKIIFFITFTFFCYVTLKYGLNTLQSLHFDSFLSYKFLNFLLFRDLIFSRPESGSFNDTKAKRRVISYFNIFFFANLKLKIFMLIN